MINNNNTKTKPANSNKVINVMMIIMLMIITVIIVMIIITSTTAVHPRQLEVKEQDISLTKLIISLSAFKRSSQFINSFVRYSRFQGLMNLMATPSQKLLKYFQLSRICTSMQKISSFHLFIIEILPFIDSQDQTGHTHF